MVAIVKHIPVRKTVSATVAYILREDACILASSNVPGWDGDMKEMMREFELALAGRKRRSSHAVEAHHIIQNFQAGQDLTPQMVNQMGVELVHRLFGDEYTFVVATQDDTWPLVHNHILVCNVSNKTGRAWHTSDKNFIHHWQEVNDEIQHEYGLLTLSDPGVKVSSDGVTFTVQSTQPEPKQEQEDTIVSHRLRQREESSRSQSNVYGSINSGGGRTAVMGLLDMAAVRASRPEEIPAILAQSHIGVEVKNGVSFYSFHGQVFSSSKLPHGYALRDLESKVGRHDEGMIISVAKSLIVKEKNHAYLVWVPGTHRTLRMTIPEELVLEGEGHPHQLVVMVGLDSRFRLSKKNGQYAGSCDRQFVADHFTPLPLPDGWKQRLAAADPMVDHLYASGVAKSDDQIVRQMREQGVLREWDDVDERQVDEYVCQSLDFTNYVKRYGFEEGERVLRRQIRVIARQIHVVGAQPQHPSRGETLKRLLAQKATCEDSLMRVQQLRRTGVPTI